VAAGQEKESVEPWVALRRGVLDCTARTGEAWISCKSGLDGIEIARQDLDIVIEEVDDVDVELSTHSRTLVALPGETGSSGFPIVHGRTGVLAAHTLATFGGR
jgi:hypothetical protein